MNWYTGILTQCILCALLFHLGVGLTSPTTLANTTDEPRPREMEDDDLILFNVAAKGRVVELLANELARTEIIRALLVQYAKECVQNVTVLEKYCLDCMVERCQNRISECKIESPPLAEVITHDPIPIPGLQFLSQAPRDVQRHLKDFTSRARTDILDGIPESLRQESEIIIHKEVDQSLQDLTDNIDTDKALQTLSVHMQKAADNVHKIPDLSTKVGTIIITNEDHAVNLAELLASRLQESRPFVDSIEHNSQRIADQMPTIIDHVVERVSVFKDKITGMVGNVLNAFTDIMDEQDTNVMNGNNMQGFQSNFNPNAQMPGNIPMNQNMQQGFPGSPQFQSQQRFMNQNGQQQFMISQFPTQFPGQAFPSAMPVGQQFQQVQPQMTHLNILQGPMQLPNLPQGPPPPPRNNQFNRRRMPNQKMLNTNVGQNVVPSPNQQQQQFPVDLSNQIPQNNPLNNQLPQNNPINNQIPQNNPKFLPTVAQPRPVNGLPPVQVVSNIAPTRPGVVQSSMMTPQGQKKNPNQGPMIPPNIQQNQVQSVRRINNGGSQSQQIQQQGPSRQRQQDQNQQQNQNPQNQRTKQIQDQQMQHNQNHQHNHNQQVQQNQMLRQGQNQQQIHNQQVQQSQMQQRQNQQQNQNTQTRQNQNTMVSGRQTQSAMIPGRQTQSGMVPGRQSQSGMVSGRQRRHADEDCENLEKSPERYCKQYESHCHNCTLEKRLRFEVCGEGVEKARDEIKRLDESVEGYLTTYENFILGQRLVLKVELDDSKRLHKTNSYYDAYVTAKIGDSILRYKTKMILNSDDTMNAGSQVGDEIWEILWEKDIFREVKRKAIERPDVSVLGQTQNRRISGVQPAAHGSGHSTGSVSIGSRVCLVLGTAASLLMMVL